MADSVEIKLDQLTQAIKGLYAKSSSSQGEIYNVLNTLAQRYESVTSVSSEKIASTIVNEFRKSLENKYGQTNQSIKELETGLKDFIHSQASNYPKFSSDLSKLLVDTTNAYSKLNSQEHVLQGIAKRIDQQISNNPTEEIIKLSENFMTFSRGFENITITLNKNFADFLAQIKQNSPKEEFLTLKSEVDIISGNINSVISAISIIDSKYRDLTGLIDTIQNRENIFNDALREVHDLTYSLNAIKEQISYVDTRDEVQLLNKHIKEQVESIKVEIQKIVLANSKEPPVEELSGLIENLQGLASNVTLTKEEIGTLSLSLSNVEQELKDVKTSISFLGKNDIVDAINALNYDIKNINTPNFELLNNNFETLGLQIASIKELVSSAPKTDSPETITAIEGLKSEIKNFKEAIGTELAQKIPTSESFSKYDATSKDNIQTLLEGINSLKNDITLLNQGNIKILQEPIERALANLKNHDIGKEIEELQYSLDNVTLEIQKQIQNLRLNLGEVYSDTNVAILTKIAEAIPQISQKLDLLGERKSPEFKIDNSAVQQGIDGLNDKVLIIKDDVIGIKDDFTNIKQDIVNSINDIKESLKSVNIETEDTLKIDLQKLSNSIISSIERVNEKIEKELTDFKVDEQNLQENLQLSLQKLSNTITQNIENVSYKVQKELTDFKVDGQNNTTKQQEDIQMLLEKLSGLELELTNFAPDTINKLSDVKKEIIDNISNIEKTNKHAINSFDEKLDRVLDCITGPEIESIGEDKPLRTLLGNIESKIEKANLQQIHNAKELLDEIEQNRQTIANSNSKGQNFSKIIDKIENFENSLENANENLSDEIREIKKTIEQKLKEQVQKISELIEKPKETIELRPFDEDLSVLSKKINDSKETSKLIDELKENFRSEFLRLEKTIKKIKSQDDDSGYSYTLEDIESDLAKIRLSIEKSGASNNENTAILEKIAEIRNINVETMKNTRDTEAEIGHLSGWCRDAISKIEDLALNLDELKNTGFEDIKTRLYQSEKSKQAVNEQNIKIENGLKLLIKNARNQDEKIAQLNKKIEILTKSQAEGFNPGQFIDIFYENMTQTKMLSNRVEIIEDKINSIQTTLEKLMSYVES